MASPSSNGSTNREGKQPVRISKPDMFMVLALWMERSPLAESPKIVKEGADTVQEINKAGAVYVLPNDRALSVDCSQAGVHAAVSALNKFGQDRVKGCQVYLSRRPCSFCAKLLVQAGVDKVFYLPFEPEVNDPQDVKRVDNLFKVAATGLSAVVPEVDVTILGEQQTRRSPYTHTRDEDIVAQFKRVLMLEYWSNEWIIRASESLQWPAFENVQMKEQVFKAMDKLLEWIARTTLADVPDGIEFFEIDANTFHCKPYVKPSGAEGTSELTKSEFPSIPTPNDDCWQQLALHMSRLAQMLSQRSDDPPREVGCVLMLHNDVVAIGWNGFPAKALYGEFPKTSVEKEHYVIHAEQNALMTRNIRDMKHESSTLYVNEIPCSECMPLLIQAGVKHIIVPKYEGVAAEGGVHENIFYSMLRGGKFKGYGSHMKPQERPEGVKMAARKV